MSSLSFEVPPSYLWIVERGLIGFDGSSPLEPWHLLKPEARRALSDVWPGGPGLRPLIAFAKRQDNDDYACFELLGSTVGDIVVIHGWTVSGYDINHRFPSLWEWLKFVIDEMHEWQEGQVE